LWLVAIIPLVKWTRLWNFVEEPKELNYSKLILYLVIEVIVIIALLTWIPYEVALLIHQAFSSPGGKILSKIVIEIKAGLDENTEQMLGLHPSSSPEQGSSSSEQTDVPQDSCLLHLIPMGLVAFIPLVKYTRLYNYMEEPKYHTFCRLVFYLVLEAILLTIMIACSWIQLEFVLMIHQTWASPGGKLFIKVLTKLMTRYDEDTQDMLGLHPSSSPEQGSGSSEHRGLLSGQNLESSSSRWGR
jgi:hypothetical protein